MCESVESPSTISGDATKTLLFPEQTKKFQKKIPKTTNSATSSYYYFLHVHRKTVMPHFGEL
jgi:hypothetical protein